MRKFIQAMCLLLASLLACGLLLPVQYGNTYLGEMEAKHQLLLDTPGRRIIVIGGSSVPFALNSSLLEQALPGWSVVDFGLYADLGTTAMLDWAGAGIREGDLVILAPEQEHQALSCYVGGESIWQACDGDFRQLLSLSPRHWETVAAAFPAFAGKKLRYTLFGAPEPEGIYSRDSFNAKGDIECTGRERNILPDGWQKVQPIFFVLPEPEFLEAVNRFAAGMRARGAETVWHFSPMNAAAVVPGADLDGYYDALSSLLDMPILGNPHDCVMDSGWFFDSNFHLNAAGSLVFTRLLAQDLKLWFRDSSPTELPMPEMPAAYTPAFRGDDSCEDCFTYAWQETSWCIQGLTEEGSRRASLILPTYHDGQPVAAISETALQGNPNLRELTVQPNISQLWDGLLDGCTHMQTLILTSADPAAYSVGDALMHGTAFRIQVPADALDRYKRSYFWQRYEPWLVAR